MSQEEKEKKRKGFIAWLRERLGFSPNGMGNVPEGARVMKTMNIRRKAKGFLGLVGFYTGLGERGRYIVLLAAIIFLSLPFVATSDMVERFFGLSPVRYIAKFFGLESVMASINPKYSTDILKAAFDKLKSEAAFYNPLMGKVPQGVLENVNSTSLVRVGNLDNYDSSKNSKKGRKIKSGKDSNEIVTDDMEGGFDDFDSLKGGGNPIGSDFNKNMPIEEYMGFDNGFGMFSEINEENRFGGRLFGSGSSILQGSSVNMFVGRGSLLANKLSSDVSILNKAQVSEIGKTVITKSSFEIPTVKSSSLKKGSIVKISKGSSIYAFGWRATGRLRDASTIDVAITGDRRALFQMGETMATTVAAYKLKPAYEYQSAYTGATYDGNPVNAAGIVETVTGDYGSGVDLSGNNYPTTLVDSTHQWDELANRCAKTSEAHGARISQLQYEIDELLKNNKPPKKCCDCGAVQRWNRVVDAVIERCNKINQSTLEIAKDCQNSSPNTVDCYKNYGKLYMKCCKCKKGFFGGFLGFLAIFIFALVGFLVGFLVFGTLAAGMIGAAVGIAIGGVLSGMNPVMALLAAIIPGGSLLLGAAGGGLVDKDSAEAAKAVEEVYNDVRNGKNK